MTILEEAHQLTSQDRQDSYGHPADDYAKVAGMFNALFAAKLKADFTPEDLQLTMVLVKLSRFVHKPKRDSLVDAAGYLRLVEMTQERRG